MELEENSSDWGIPDRERQIRYVFTYVWILAVKSMINIIQSIEP